MSESDQAQTTGQAGIGSLLRDARERRGETLADVAHVLKLSTHQVAALEAERFDLLPGLTFVRGFLRNYARHVRLDLDTRIAALGGPPGSEQVRLSTVTNASGEIPSAGVSAARGVRSALVVVAVMLLALALGWYFDWFKMDEAPQPVATSQTSRTATQREEAPVSPAEAPSEPADEDMLSGVVADDGAPVELEPVAEMPAPPVASVDAPLSDSGSSMADETASVPPSDAVTPELATTGSERASVETAAVGHSGAVSAEAGVDRLSFSLRGESWIQVRDRDGVALYTGTGAPGSTRVVQGQPPFSIVVGNAAMVSLEFNGQAVDLVPHTSQGGVARLTVR